MSTTHTILLVQPTKKPEGRTYSDYESVNDCMEGVCRIYEEHLKKSNPSSSQITYDISQVRYYFWMLQLTIVIDSSYSAVWFYWWVAGSSLLRLQGKLQILPTLQPRVDQRKNLHFVEEAGNWKITHFFLLPSIHHCECYHLWKIRINFDGSSA